MHNLHTNLSTNHKICFVLLPESSRKAGTNMADRGTFVMLFISSTRRSSTLTKFDIIIHLPAFLWANFSRQAIYLAVLINNSGSRAPRHSPRCLKSLLAKGLPSWLQRDWRQRSCLAPAQGGQVMIQRLRDWQLRVRTTGPSLTDSFIRIFIPPVAGDLAFSINKLFLTGQSAFCSSSVTAIAEVNGRETYKQKVWKVGLSYISRRL